MKENTLNPKLLGFAILLGVIAIAISVTMYLQVSAAGSFSGPSGPPPSGVGLLAEDNGNLGVGIDTPTSLLTVNGELDVLGNRILNVSNPSVGTDGVNRDWVLAQAGGGSPIYYRTCGWHTFDDNGGQGLPSSGTLTAGACVVTPTCEAGDTQLGAVDNWITTIDTEFVPEGSGFGAPSLGGWSYHVAGVERVICQITP